ncbi:MAG: 50S ribosomal protein L4 [Promethearchaeota archaeon]|nr:MAG: 50S ribosomal protein L4 [Candidatus Lokiarchaeota archaeon]
MQKLNIFNLEGDKIGTIESPTILETNPRVDIIRKASEVSQSRRTQPQGRRLDAGLKTTAEGWGTGHALSRAPRIKGSGFPTARNVGRVPFAKGGRRTHPIKANKNIKKKLNKKAKRLAIVSAISASSNSEWIKKRGHIIDKVPQIPLIIDDKIQTIKKTSQIHRTLCNLGFNEELLRIKNKYNKIRAGKGKRRGRKYKNAKSILIIIKEDFGIFKAARNIPGVDVVLIENLSINDLAPGGQPGRAIIWTQSAFNELNYLEVYN